jgi:LPS export ABC transporter protein LptC
MKTLHLLTVRSFIGIPGLVILVLSAVACQETETGPIAAPELLETGADAVMVGMSEVFTINGVREGEVVADTAYLYDDSATVVLINPVLTLFTEAGALRARVTSEWGKLYQNTDVMMAQGNVVLTVAAGNRRVEGPELNYDPNGDRIWSDSLTTLYEEGAVSTGLGFESDLDFRNMVVGPGSIRRTGSGGGIRF